MKAIVEFADFLLHLDQHLILLTHNYGAVTYLIVFVIIFGETGLVIAPFLPGDSLLFALGTIAAINTLNPLTLMMTLSVAAILGDSLNYKIGRYLAPKVFHHEKIRFVKREYLERTQKFFEKHGNKAIVFARFIPIVRTFTPFMAGVGEMKYSRFLMYNIVGGILWVGLFIAGGYFFGNLPWVQQNFSIVILMIIFASLIPSSVEYARHRFNEPK